jgi:outer membrane protein OmpA-like peptidoglycan-associated protein
LIGTLLAIAFVSAWLSTPITAPALPATVTNLAAEPSRPAQDATAQLLSPGAQENTSGPTEPQPPVAPSSAPVPTPPEPAVATSQIEREAIKPQIMPDAAGAAPAPPYCFSAFNVPFAPSSALPIMKGLDQSIEHLRRLMAEHTEAVLLVEGHADSTGTEQHNILLSFSRAKAVADLLGRLGIPTRRMTIRAAGASEAKGKAAGSASDRHTLIRIEGVESCNGAKDATGKQ